MITLHINKRDCSQTIVTETLQINKNSKKIKMIKRKWTKNTKQIKVSKSFEEAIHRKIKNPSSHNLMERCPTVLVNRKTQAKITPMLRAPIYSLKMLSVGRMW